MQPTFSIIFFTTASGAGYGMLALFALGLAFNFIPANPLLNLSSFILALSAISFGLLSSTFHLGHPERAWRALSQWRSSWLSREGVLALLTYIPAILLIVNWNTLHQSGHVYSLLGIMTTLLCLLTVYCTSMIYASIKAIQAWHNHWVPVVYISLSLMSGAILLNTLSISFGEPMTLLSIISALMILISALCKLAYWQSISNQKRISSTETATGLGHLGKVSQLQAPHTERNYLQNEMGFQIARKHAKKLRRVCITCCFVLPFVLNLMLFFEHKTLNLLSSYLCVFSLVAGLLVERWLFFAEAEHTVSLYYGQTGAEAGHSPYNS